MQTRFLALATALLLTTFAGVACNNKNEGIANQKQIEVQLKLAGLNNVNLRLDKDTKVARLDGTVKTDDQKARAERIVRETAPNYAIANEIGVRQKNASGENAKAASNQYGAIKTARKNSSTETASE